MIRITFTDRSGQQRAVLVEGVCHQGSPQTYESPEEPPECYAEQAYDPDTREKITDTFTDEEWALIDAAWLSHHEALAEIDADEEAYAYYEDHMKGK